MSTLFDALTRRRHSHRRHARGHPNAAHDLVLASLGFRPRRRLGKPARILLILLGGAAVIATWTGWEVMTRRAGASGLAAARPAPPATTRQVVPAPVSEPAGPQVQPAPAGAIAEEPAPEEPAAGHPADPVPRPTAPAAVAPEPEARTAEPRAPAPEPPIRALTATPVPTATPEVPRDAGGPDAMSLALYHHRAGDFDKALAAYRSVLQQNELNAAVHNNLGLLYQERGMLDEAAGAFQRAIILDERYALAHSNYGVTLLRQGRPDAAAAQFRRALDIEPRNADALVNLALAARASGNREEARTALQRALAESPLHALAHYNLAVLQDEAGDASRAIVHYRAYLDHAGAGDPDRAARVRARLGVLGGS